MLRLIHISVGGLLGRFDHSVAFPKDDEFVVLYGLNGVGKTKLLELTNFTFALRFARVREIPFNAAEFRFDDGTRLSISRTPHRGQLMLDTNAELKLDELEHEPTDIVVNLRRPATGEEVEDWMPHRNAAISGVSTRVLADYIEATTPLIRVGRDLFRHARTGDTFSTQEAVEHYGHILPDSFKRRAGAKVPTELRSFASDIRTRLIETQRLLMQLETGTELSRSRSAVSATVSEDSADLVRRLSDALAVNSKTSQGLDRSFPERILRAYNATTVGPQGGPEISDDMIRERYARQSEVRKRLAEISVLDASYDLPLPDTELLPWQRVVLWTYLNDTEDKLATFQPILDRIQLLREIVNSRFRYTSFQIDSEKGFKFITEGGREIQPTSLSSGEQHELVLTYSLLFKTDGHSLVLIDEPEISLHVSWQQAFLSDLVRISKVTGLRFIVATHSPQIVHKWWDRAVELGDPEDENG